MGYPSTIGIRRRLAAVTIALAAMACALPTTAHGAIRTDARGHRIGVLLRAPAAAAAFRASVFSSGNLAYNGGPVMHTNRTYVVYWDPSSGIGASFKSGVEGFLQNVAADSGRSTNVYSVDTQYYDGSGNIGYSSTYGGAYVDTTSLPANGCSAPGGSRPVCLSDSQIQTELAAFISRSGLPTGLGDLYFIITPPSADTCYQSGQCSNNTYCAYHGAYSSGGEIVYAQIPYPEGGCPQSESPNGGDGSVDQAIDSMSHEHNEAITDPLGSAWYDSGGYEIGDKCASSFGSALGGSPGSEWNQSIAGGHYYVQAEWSNNGSSCALSAQPAPSPSFAVSGAPAAGSPVSFDASASTDAGGTITSYSFDFGDGTSASGTGPYQSHVYGAPGLYSVTLTVTDNTGASATTTRNISVADVPPSCQSGALTVAANAAATVALPCSGIGALTHYILSLPEHGRLERLDDGHATVVYVPDPGFHGGDSFTYVGVDGNGVSSGLAQIVLNVQSPPLITHLGLTRHGTRIAYTLAEAGVTTFYVERQTVRAHCVRSAARCRVLTRLHGAVSKRTRAGSSALRLGSVLGRARLSPGVYELVALFRGVSGRVSQTSLLFRVAR